MRAVREGALDAAREHDAAVELAEQAAGSRVVGRGADRAQALVEPDLDADLIAPDRSGRRHPAALGKRVGGLGAPAQRCELLCHARAEHVPALDELRLRRGG